MTCELKHFHILFFLFDKCIDIRVGEVKGARLLLLIVTLHQVFRVSILLSPFFGEPM